MMQNIAIEKFNAMHIGSNQTSTQVQASASWSTAADGSPRRPQLQQTPPRSSGRKPAARGASRRRSAAQAEAPADTDPQRRPAPLASSACSSPSSRRSPAQARSAR